MKSRVFDAVRQCAPHVVIVVAMSSLWNAWTMGAVLGLGLVVALSRLRKNKATFLGNFIVMLGGGAAAYGLARTLDGRIQVELASLFLGFAVARLSIDKPLMPRAVDVAMMSFALVSLGASRDIDKSVYFAAAVVFGTLALFFLSDAPHLRIFRARAPSALLGLVVAAGVAASLSGLTKKLTSGTGTSALFARWAARTTGFNGKIHLQDGELTPSNTIVMRIRGERVDYLRGTVLDDFNLDEWHAMLSLPEPKAVENERGPIEVDSTAPTKFLFAPRGGVGITEGAYLDAYGIAHVPNGISNFTIDAHGGPPDTPPTPHDTVMKQDIRSRLAPLAHAIVGDETNPEKQLDLIEHYLSANYHYTLSRHSKSNERYAILDFLFHSKEGQCEFFATAMALLARTLDIPARIATGYRVVEQNAYGGYWVVREKHAHSWVEAWSSEKNAFVTRDPTPHVEALFETEETGPGALFDAARTKLGDLATALGQNRGWLLLVLTVLVVLLIGRGQLASLFGRRRAKEAEGARPYFLDLSKALDEAGLARDPAEGVETYADRVESAGEAEAAALLRRYALHRYGGEEDDATLSRAFEKLAKVGLATKTRTAA
jgi:hypothetical protein